MHKYLFFLFALIIQPMIYGQVKLSLEEKEIIVNGSSISLQQNKAALDALLGDKSSYGYIVGSFNPDTDEENSIKRRSYRFKKSGFSVQYYAKEPGIYNIFLEIRSSHHKPSKDKKIVYPNSFKDADILIDSTTTLDQALRMIGTEKLIKNGQKSFYKILSPYLLYSKNDLLIELTFDPATKLIKLVSIYR